MEKLPMPRTSFRSTFEFCVTMILAWGFTPFIFPTTSCSSSGVTCKPHRLRQGTQKRERHRSVSGEKSWFDCAPGPFC